MDLLSSCLLSCLLALCVVLSECTSYYQPVVTISAGSFSLNRAGEYASYIEAPVDVKAASLILEENDRFGCHFGDHFNLSRPNITSQLPRPMPRVEPSPLLNAALLVPLAGGCTPHTKAYWAYTNNLRAVVFYYFPSQKKPSNNGEGTRELPITVATLQLKETELNDLKSALLSANVPPPQLSIVGEYNHSLFSGSHTFYFVVFAFCILMTLSCLWFTMSYIKKFRYSMRARRRRAETQNEIRRVMSALPVRTHKVSKGNEELTCAVCLDPFRNKELIRTLPCDHEFHKKCIDPWIKIKRTCPMCKQNISENIPHGNRRRKTTRNRSTNSRASNSQIPRNERADRETSLLEHGGESSDSDSQSEITHGEVPSVHVVMVQPSLDALRIHIEDDDAVPPADDPPVHVAIPLEGEDEVVAPRTTATVD